MRRGCFNFLIMQIPPLTGFDVNCVELMNSAPSSHARNCFRSAMQHLKKAEKLLDVDPGMAAFRAITAEEEAASGLMRALVDLNYPGAEGLNPHNHSHKHAVIPFVEIIQLFFGQTIGRTFKNLTLHIKNDAGVRLLKISMQLPFGDDSPWMTPEPPLNLGVTVTGSGDAPDYASQIKEFAEAQGKGSLRNFLKKEANIRNEILYASPEGYPEVRALDPAFILERRRRVLVIIKAYLLIYPYAERQPYVEHALTVFVSILSQLKRK